MGSDDIIQISGFVMPVVDACVLSGICLEKYALRFNRLSLGFCYLSMGFVSF
jgi:hypothetical protein